MRKMKKVLFTDLDGTLLKNDKSISGKNKAAIREMQKAGHQLVISTGRTPESALDAIKELNLTGSGCYLSACNGAVLYDCSRQCISKEYTLPLEQVRYLFSEGARYGIHVHSYADGYVISEREDPETLQYERATGRPYRICEDVFSVIKKEPNKVLLISLDDRERLLEFQRDHLDWEKDRCSSFFSCREYLEYCPKDINKGSSLMEICRILNVDPGSVFAAGDSENDCFMLRAAGMGIAVKNAAPEVKAASDFITENDNEHDAVAEIIERFILN